MYYKGMWENWRKSVPHTCNPLRESGCILQTPSTLKAGLPALLYSQWIDSRTLSDPFQCLPLSIAQFCRGLTRHLAACYCPYRTIDMKLSSFNLFSINNITEIHLCFKHCSLKTLPFDVKSQALWNYICTQYFIGPYAFSLTIPP